MKASQAAKKMRTQHFGITYKCVDIYLCSSSSSSRFRDMSDRWGIYLECFTSDLSACPALCHQINFFSILGRATLSWQIYLFHVRLTCCWLGPRKKRRSKIASLFSLPPSFLLIYYFSVRRHFELFPTLHEEYHLMDCLTLGVVS